VNAQSGSIEGVISDSELKVPVAGASVNLNTIKGDNSDLFGRFSLPFVTPVSTNSSFHILATKQK
jgi:hypothetical protein